MANEGARRRAEPVNARTCVQPCCAGLTCTGGPPCLAARGPAPGRAGSTMPHIALTSPHSPQGMLTPAAPKPPEKHPHFSRMPRGIGPALVALGGAKPFQGKPSWAWGCGSPGWCTDLRLKSDARIHQAGCHVELEAQGVVQSRATDGVHVIDVGTSLDQQLDHRQVVALNRLHDQRRLAQGHRREPVGRDAVVEQHLHHPRDRRDRASPHSWARCHPWPAWTTGSAPPACRRFITCGAFFGALSAQSASPSSRAESRPGAHRPLATATARCAADRPCARHAPACTRGSGKMSAKSFWIPDEGRVADEGAAAPSGVPWSWRAGRRRAGRPAPGSTQLAKKR